MDLTEGANLLEDVQRNKPTDIWVIGLKLFYVDDIYPLDEAAVAASLSTDIEELNIGWSF